MTHGLRPHDPGQKLGTARRALIKIKRKWQERGPVLVNCDSQLQGQVDSSLAPITSAVGTELGAPRDQGRGCEGVGGGGRGSSRKWMGRAGGGAVALCPVLFTGLHSCVQNLSSQITQLREPSPPDSVEKLPRDWGLWPGVSGFLLLRPSQGQGEKTAEA